MTPQYERHPEQPGCGTLVVLLVWLVLLALLALMDLQAEAAFRPDQGRS